jgi:hypothetical protein
VKIVKVDFITFFPPSFYDLHLRSKYSPQQFVLVGYLLYDRDLISRDRTIQTDPGGISASYPTGAESSFSGSKAAWTVKLASHLCLLPRLSVSFTSTTPPAFMGRCYISSDKCPASESLVVKSIQSYC